MVQEHAAPWLREGGCQRGWPLAGAETTPPHGASVPGAAPQAPRVPTLWDFALGAGAGRAHPCPENTLGQGRWALVRENDGAAPRSTPSADAAANLTLGVGSTSGTGTRPEAGAP